MATTQMLPAGWYPPPAIRWYTWGDYAWYSLARRPTYQPLSLWFRVNPDEAGDLWEWRVLPASRGIELWVDRIQVERYK